VGKFGILCDSERDTPPPTHHSSYYEEKGMTKGVSKWTPVTYLRSHFFFEDWIELDSFLPYTCPHSFTFSRPPTYSDPTRSPSRLTCSHPISPSSHTKPFHRPVLSVLEALGDNSDFIFTP
jgi:hypothetical protein